MKRVKGIVIGMMLAALMSTGTAFATAKKLDVSPSIANDGNGEYLHLGNVPSEVKIVAVHVYCDATSAPSKKIGSVTSELRLELPAGKGFNFEWSDASGTYWQLITPDSSVGAGLSIDCSNAGGCKYLRAQ